MARQTVVRRIRCKHCGERFDHYVDPSGGRPPLYCDACRVEVKNEQAAERMARMRRRQSRVKHVQR